MKITMQEFEEFEKQYMFEVLKSPDYRIGQAFYNSFPEIALSMEDDGDIGYSQASRLWNSKDRDEVLKLIDWYLIK
jgi:hypothetical protein